MTTVRRVEALSLIKFEFSCFFFVLFMFAVRLLRTDAHVTRGEGCSINYILPHSKDASDCRNARRNKTDNDDATNAAQSC